MKERLFKYWDHLWSSFWFLPLVMAGGAVALAVGTVRLDTTVADSWLRRQPWAYTGGAEGASAVLGAIAGSMITVAGVVFSLTLVALSQASSQFGPRLLRNFMRDTINQVVLGAFVATFLYSLLVLRTIRRNESAFVPHLSVTVSVALAVASLVVLIYFIHHVSVSIQADEIVKRVGAELLQGIDRLFPEQLGEEAPEHDVERPESLLPDAFDGEACPVVARGDGYVQRISADELMVLATKEDLLLRVDQRPGGYVIAGVPLAHVWPGERLDDELAARINAAFILDHLRTPAQDLEHVVGQLVEIAVRALSPGVNDPFTAVTCVDRLGSGLSRLARRKMPSPGRHDEEHRLRVVADPVTFPVVLDAAFDPIRQHSRSSAAVILRMLDTIGAIAGFARRPEDRAALRRHAEMIARSGREGLPEENDRRAVEDRYRTAMRVLEGRRTARGADFPSHSDAS